VERSRRPQHSPNATPGRVAEALEELRRRHPSWGAGKLLTILGGRHPAWQLPTRSTGCELLKRAGWCASGADDRDLVIPAPR